MLPAHAPGLGRETPFRPDLFLASLYWYFFFGRCPSQAERPFWARQTAPARPWPRPGGVRGGGAGQLPACAVARQGLVSRSSK
ncbi:hypothetical protein IF1G_00534 [Cordyceps javanica]|uniref:Uncharacterized protein n=1 Tax=Cordyceps javanica TaxID=43265 RepID=A0A545VFV9_9HYPO|nr:hypothetical protein IF1G_00534 [Cordyceps javanica]